MQDMVTRNPSFPDGPMSPDMESTTGLLVREEVMHRRRARTAWPCLGGRTADSQVRPWPLRHFCSHPLHRVLPTASGGGGATRSLRRCYGRRWILLDAIIAQKFCYKSSIILLHRINVWLRCLRQESGDVSDRSCCPHRGAVLPVM